MGSVYSFADINIGIESVFPYVHEYCSDYVTGMPADFSVKTDMTDILFERSRAENQSASDPYLETLAVYRKIAEKLPEYDAFLFHGSAVAAEGAAYIFTAKSGTGKSTHTALWCEMLGDKAQVINDDKPIIRLRSDGTAYVYGTPWNGKHRLSVNSSAPVRAICIIDRSPENSIYHISREQALPVLIQQMYRPSDPSALKKSLELIANMNVEFYHLFCNMETDAAELSFNTMRKMG